MLPGDENPETVENIDGFVELDDGTTRTFTALTLGEIDRLIRKWQRSGESMSGAYLRVPDLVVVRAGGVASIVAVIEDLADELPIIEVDDGP